MRAKLVRSSVLGLAAMSMLTKAVQAASWDFGASTTDWHTAANWGGDLPGPGENANIGNFALTNAPVISANAGAVHEIIVSGGESFLTIANTATAAVTAASNVLVGYGGANKGTITQEGGTFTAQNNLKLGVSDTAEGTYNLNGGTLTTNNTNLFVGEGGTAKGTFNQIGGTLSANEMIVGGASSGFVNTQGGRQTLAVMIIGAYTSNGIGGSGQVNQSGGDVTVGNRIRLGFSGSGAVGAYTMSGGTLDTAGATLGEGTGAKGVFTLNGGTVSAHEFSVSGGAEGILNVNGGVLNLTKEDGSQLIVGNGGGSSAVGTVVQTGGAVTVRDNIRLGLGGPGVTGTYSLSGGTLQARGIFFGNNTGTIGTVVQSGGTLTSGGGWIGSNDRTGTLTLRDTAATQFTGTVEVGLGGTGPGHGKVVLDGSKTGEGATNLKVGVDFKLGAHGELQAIIDSAAATAPVPSSVMRGIDVTFTAVLESGSLLDVSYDGDKPANNTTFTLITAGVIVNGGLAFAPGVDTSSWAFNIVDNVIVDDVNRDLLTVTYIPEPASLGLLFTGAIGLVARRRRRVRTTPGSQF